MASLPALLASGSQALVLSFRRMKIVLAFGTTRLIYSTHPHFRGKGNQTMPTIEDIFAEHEKAARKESDATMDRDLARSTLRTKAVEWIAAHPGTPTANLPRELLQGFKDAEHARETRNSLAGWFVVPPPDEEDEAEEEFTCSECDDSDCEGCDRGEE